VKRKGSISILKDLVKEFEVELVGIQKTMLKYFQIAFLES
jgi:hypothetical protein